MFYYHATGTADYGPYPFVANIGEDARKNENFRRTLWTGRYLQTTLMSIPVRGEIGLERHPDTDQMIRIEEGRGLVRIGNTKDELDFQQHLCKGDTVFVPAGVWHNIINMGMVPLQVSSTYAPPAHLRGTVHRTKEDDTEEY